jgi:hypothetical protein
MPIRNKYDNISSFFQWGHDGKKYYYTSGDYESKIASYKKGTNASAGHICS